MAIGENKMEALDGGTSLTLSVDDAGRSYGNALLEIEVMVEND